jgi:hypothetical protein
MASQKIKKFLLAQELSFELLTQKQKWLALSASCFSFSLAYWFLFVNGSRENANQVDYAFLLFFFAFALCDFCFGFLKTTIVYPQIRIRGQNMLFFFCYAPFRLWL